MSAADARLEGLERAPGSAALSRRAVQAAAVLSVLGVWLLSRPYRGIWHDASIYMGRAVADLDPGGVGRDLMFANDGQFGFSFFPTLVRQLVAWTDVSTAAVLLTGAGLALWLGAMTLLLRRLARGPALWGMLVCVAVLPAQYGGMLTLSYGEALATPRVFAEAAVLGALAGLIGGRRLAAAGLLLVAMLFHPLVGLTGAGVLWLVLCVEDRRWLWAGAAGAAALLAGAALGLPILERLFTGADPAWRDAILTWPSLVFTGEWRAEVWARAAAQGASLLVGASLLTGRARLVLFAVAAVVAAGLLVGFGWGSLLLIQLQTWRVLWLLGALGAAMSAYAAVELWKRGGAARATLAFLALAWAGSWTSWIAGPAAALALVNHVSMLRGRPLLDSRMVAVGAALCAVGAYGLFASYIVRVVAPQVAGMPADLPPPRLPPFLFLPLVVPAAALAVTGIGRRWAAAASAGSVALLAASLLLWDQREPGRRAIDEGAGRAELRALLASREGSVFWMEDALNAWFLAGRAAYWGEYQGAPRVFSRPLALEWVRRGDQLTAWGLAMPYGRGGVKPSPPSTRPLLTAAAADRLCGDRASPGWIVAPAERVAADAASRVTGTWRSPAPVYRSVLIGERHVWAATRAYAVIPCGSRRR